MRAVVVGAGYVGLATGVGLALHGHRIQVVERDPQRRHALEQRRVPFHEPTISAALSDLSPDAFEVVEPSTWDRGADVAFICVDTPSMANGTLDTSQVYAVAESLADCPAPPTIVIRSTVPPGTTRAISKRLNQGGAKPVDVVVNPEFLREGSALPDFESPARRLVGGDSPAATKRVCELYAFSDAPVITTDPTAAELIKLAANSMLAARVAMVNEVADLANALDADTSTILQAIGADPRIGPDFMVPGLGFGGSCLPKDLDAMRAALRSTGGRANVFDAAATTNRAGVERVARRALDLVRPGERVGIIGLGFKPGTDSVRSSQAIALVQALLARGAAVDVHDSVAEAGARAILGDSVRYHADPASLFQSSRVVICSHYPYEGGADNTPGVVVLDATGRRVG